VNGDRGHAAVELSLTIALLLIPVAIAVLAFGPWAERRVFARAAAAEASRAAVVGLSVDAGNIVLRDMAGDQGLSSNEIRVSWCGGEAIELDASTNACSFARGGVVDVEVEVLVPLVTTPWGDVGGLWSSASHGEPVDLYRSLP
jgi:hypothetical protein